MNRDILSGLVMFGMSAAYYYGGAVLPTSILDTAVSSSTFPKMLGGAGMILSAVLVVQGVRQLRAADAAAGQPVSAEEWLRHRKALGLLLIASGYLVVLEFLGYVIALLALIPAVAVFHGVRPGKTLAIVTLAGAVLFWLFFVKLLGIHMPLGQLWRAVGLVPS